MAYKMIITLSTIPPRFGSVGKTLVSILNQKLAVDQIILYIPQRYRRFPEWTGELPSVPLGVLIRRTPDDLGPATKILPAIREFAGRDVDILFCDDDVVYDASWSHRFATVRKTMPDVCIAEAGKDLPDINIASRPRDRLPRMGADTHNWRFRLSSMLKHRQRRASKYSGSGYCDVFLGVSGVMVKSAFFSESVFEIPNILWTVDDYWLSGHLEANGIPIWLNADAPRRFDRPNRRVAALMALVHEDHDRHAANQACVDYYRRTYGIWQPSAELLSA
ncbi:glycosyltransferase family 2 protein [Phyllobacterium leguminum]|uniref:glycosyltransferase family 2 protein n=1 Tax=Phyllobacterium leguminum TaxID=314237 RepID=UPI0011B375A2|nr:glycosyltransferase family 2 protein [Phyllobacterium leguminum]